MPHQPAMIFLAAFGPGDASHGAFHRMFHHHLPQAGIPRSGLDALLPWAMLPLDAPETSGLEQVRRRLESWLNQLEHFLQLEDGLGAMVTMGLGEDPVRGPFGEALEGALVLTEEIVPGELRLDPRVSELMEHLPLRLAPVRGSPCRRWIPERLALYWTEVPTSAHGMLRAVAHGDISALRGLDLRIQVIPARRGPPPAPPAESAAPPGPDPPDPSLSRAHQGDQIEIEAHLPPGSSLHVLRQLETGFLPVPDLPAARATDAPKHWQARFVLDDRAGVERVVALVTPRPPPPRTALPQIGVQLRPADDDLALVTFAHLLREGERLSPFLLIPGHRFHLEPDRPDKLPMSIEPLRVALDEGRYNAVLELLHERLPTMISSHDRARCLLFAGAAMRRRGDCADASQHLKEAARLAREAGDLQLAATSTRELGRALLELGRYDEALQALRDALETHDGIDDPLEAARDALNLGLLLYRLDKFEDARDAYRRVLPPARQANDRKVLAAALEGLGQACHDMGQERSAREAYLEALSVYEALGDPVGTMRVYGDLGLLELDFGRPGSAATHFLRQLERVDGLEAPASQGIVRVSLGRTYLALGNTSLARRFLLEALERLPEGDHGNCSLARVTLAELALAEGLPLEARDHLAGLEDAEAAPWVELAWRLARARGRVCEALGDADGAARAFRQGIALVERWRSRLTGAVKPYALEVAITLHKGWIAHLLARNAPAEQLLDALEHARARAFTDALVSREPYFQSDGRDAPGRETLEPWKTPPKVLNAQPTDGTELTAQSTDGTELTAQPGDTTVLTAQPTDGTELTAQPGDTTVSHGAGPPAEDSTLNRLRANLPRDVAFLVTFCLPDTVILMWVRAADVRYRCLAMSRADLAARAKQARDECAAAADSDAGATLQALSRDLLEPIADWLDALEPGTQLGIVAHGPLHQLPWAALPLPRGHRRSGAPLITTTDLFLTPSLRAAAWWLERPPPLTNGALVLADADGDLEHARLEGDLLVQSLGEVARFTGPEATWETLRHRAGTARYIHLAVHAVREDDDGPACLLLAPPPAGQPADDDWIDEGASGDAAAPDGMVGVHALAALELDAALVVLSACESGAGDLNRAGEGPDLLTWAFLAAGARAVIASGWRVPDAETLELMTTFYVQLGAGAAPATALARAQRALWKARGDDRDARAAWAGFSLVGDWRAVASIPRS